MTTDAPSRVRIARAVTFVLATASLLLAAPSTARAGSLDRFEKAHRPKQDRKDDDEDTADEQSDHDHHHHDDFEDDATVDGGDSGDGAVLLLAACIIPPIASGLPKVMLAVTSV